MEILVQVILQILTQKSSLQKIGINIPKFSERVGALIKKLLKIKIRRNYFNQTNLKKPLFLLLVDDLHKKVSDERFQEFRS